MEIIIFLILNRINKNGYNYIVKFKFKIFLNYKGSL